VQKFGGGGRGGAELRAVRVSVGRVFFVGGALDEEEGGVDFGSDVAQAEGGEGVGLEVCD